MIGERKAKNSNELTAYDCKRLLFITVWSSPSYNSHNIQA